MDITVTIINQCFSKYIRLTLLIFGLLGFNYNIVSASGIPVGRGRLILSPSVNYFFNNKYWDNSRNIQSYPNGGKFNSLSLYLYGEYGLSRKVSLIASLPIVKNHYDQSDYTKNSFGLGDAEIGARYYFANINYKVYFSAQATVIVPLYTYDDTFPIGYQKVGGEFRLLTAGSGKVGNKDFYFDVEGGVRQYVDNGGPIQIRYIGTYGLNLDRRNQVALSVSGVHSSSNFQQFNPVNPLIAKDFSFDQLTLSYGYNIQRNINLFANASRFIIGRNTGVGTTVSLSLVYKY